MAPATTKRAATTKRKPAKSATTAAPATLAPEAEVDAEPTLSVFANGGGTYPDFAYVRYYWQGEGRRPSVRPVIEKKMRPGNDPEFGSAMRVDVLIPDNASGEYIELDHLLTQYDARHPTWEPTALVQLNFTLNEAGQTPQAFFESVRRFSHDFLVAQGCPVILVLHVPGLAGSENSTHCHAMVLPRRLGPNGFGPFQRQLIGDANNRAIYEAWAEHKKLWG